ncbi:unnamed protein product [Prorocentrum cordatum]|uniref:Uncharacterized protein n=1 Tax=Prorocentrum cordatum TaxID=2364126 RepID=A0ABN9WJR7_9DINO|nr:unnamed protein product [Polarella glacialis]
MMAWIYQKHQSTLGYHCSAASGCASPSDMQLASGYAAFVRQGTRVLIIDHCVPLVEADSGSVRMWEMMQILVDMGYAVTLQPDCPKSFARTAVPLLALGIQVLAPGSFKAMAGARGTSDVSNSVPCPWDLILISRRGVFANNIMSVDRLCPRAPLIYDTVDLHFVRERKGVELALKQGDHSNIPIGDVYRDPVELGIQQAEQILEEGERREKSYMNRSDYVLVVAPAEQKLVAELFGEKKATLLTNIYPDPDMSEDDVGFAQRSGALFVGNGCHPPNLDASRFIMREIFADPTKYPSGFMHFVWSDTLRCPDVAGDIVEEARKNPSVTLHLDVSNEES